MVAVLVCGAGSIGQRHIRNLKNLGADVSVWRTRGDLLDEVSRETGACPATDLADGIAAAEAVVVATATDAHLAIAQQAAIAGKHLFIEKPVSHDLDGVDRLLDLVAKYDLRCEVGCQLRAHASLRALKGHLAEADSGRPLTFTGVVGHRLDQWRPGTDYRTCYSASSQRGGGALMDLIHEIDLVLWLIGPIETVSADLRTVSDQGLECDDLANLLLVTRSGIAGQLQMDMLSPVYRRRFEIVTDQALFRWDYRNSSVSRESSQGVDFIAPPVEKPERNHLFVTHMKHFLESISDHRLAPLCSLDDGVAALKIALAARRSAATRCSEPVHVDA